MYDRKLSLPLSANETCFLWGPRQTGKSTLLKSLFPTSHRYDLLLSDVYGLLMNRPALLREECLALPPEIAARPIIIDEVQKIPALLDEVHWLIENAGLRFILCGSSARKLKRGASNLLGGRAIRYELHPLLVSEIPDLSLTRALNHGMLPRHYMSAAPRRLLQSYVGDYLREEIVAEALIRKVPAFARFLEVAAHSSGELLNHTNVASECGVSAPTVREYYQILIDTLVGFQLPAFRRRVKRRLIQAPRFHLFDVGVTAALCRRGAVEEGSPLFGQAFEQLLTTEVRSHAAYSEIFYPMSYWRTAAGAEVDLVLGDAEVAIEIKSSPTVRDRHLKGIRAFKEEHLARRYLVVSQDPRPRRTGDGIDILPWRVFLEQLWGGGVME
jgi:uncharacterized protein